VSRRHPLLVSLRLAAALFGAALPASAAGQTVVEVQGGGSTLYDGYGATANFWSAKFDGWVGLGYLDGLRAGAFLRTTFKKDTLRLGNDVVVVRFPTDLFSGGYNVLVQCASYTRVRARSSATLFAGASAAGLGAPFFAATRLQDPLVAGLVTYRAGPTVLLSTHALVSERPTFTQGLEWLAAQGAVVGATAGVGSGRPYLGSSVAVRRGRFDVKASYVHNPRRFRRVNVPTLNQTEADRENIAIQFEPAEGISIGVGRQNYVQDSSDAVAPIRASGNSVSFGMRWRELRLTAGLYDSRSQGISNLSSYYAVGHRFTSWLDAEAFILQSRPSGEQWTTTPVFNLREQLTSRLGLSQQVTLTGDKVRLQLGGSLVTPIGEFGVDYQIVHQPFQPLDPFRSAVALTARMQLGRYSTNLSTVILPDGGINYSASGGTFLYLGEFGGIQPQSVASPRFDRFVIRGIVRDENGAAVEGAALSLDGEVVFTNSQGEFFLRVGRPRRYALAVSLDEFLLPGAWEVVSAPTTVVGQDEPKAEPVIVILRPAPAVEATPGR
jgi:hypothetical protein